jgi:hydroxymethylpyrimidine pyrophosphatase-like HAD family hydrolase
MNQLIIAIDFDGTIVEDTEGITIGDLKPHAKEVINWIQEIGYYTILWTCRTGEGLNDVIKFLKNNGINFSAINKNAPFLDFQTSQKIFANIYIDNRNLDSSKIDWLKIKESVQRFLVEQTMKDLKKKK